MIFPKISNAITQINYGQHSLTPLFHSYFLSIDGTLNICSKCLGCFPTKISLQMHMVCCTIPFIPIYEEQSFKISKVHDNKTKNLLALLSKMFIKNKTVFYEVENYDFYIVYASQVIGYFSRQKGSENCLSCLCVWPCFQKMGWGSILLDFSCKGGFKSPERPFSKKAIFCFRKYWKYKTIGAKTVRQIAEKENMTLDDAIVGLELNGFDFKEWKLKKQICVEKPRLLSKKVIFKKESTN
jgi:histone acetyltransferase SAS2